MTRRDLFWRAIGVALTVGACSVAAALDGAALAMVVFPFAVLGITLVINGKRVVVALRAERRGHGHTAETIHAVRVRRLRRQLDPPHS